MTVVKLLAHTIITSASMQELGFTPQTASADTLAEFAGRNCYQSFGRPNPKTANWRDYLEHIIEVGHESVLEHGSASFYVEASRSVLTELTRHRHLSFSVLSQRYVDPRGLDRQFHVPPVVWDLPDGLRHDALHFIADAWEHSEGFYDRLVTIFGKAGLPRKRAREAARSVLPNMTNSPMVVSGNHRAWRYVLKQRWHVAADAEIRELAGMLLKVLRAIAPGTYQDIPDEPFGDQ